MLFQSTRILGTVRVAILVKRSISTMINDDFIEVAGHRLNYAQSGNGAHNLLCLPGALGSWRTDFQPQLEGIDKNVFTTVAWDPPGYGKSRPPDRDFSKGFFARDAQLAHGLMQKLGLCPYSVLGWSDGGITSIYLAHQQRNTNNIRKMIIWGANSYVTDEEAAMYLKIEDLKSWSDRMKKPLLDLYGEEYFQKTWSKWVETFYKVFYKAQKKNICRELIGDIKCETLVIHGRKDPLVPAEHAHYFFNQLSNSTLLLLKDAKHNLHLRYADWFNSTVKEYLTKSDFEWPLDGFDVPSSHKGEGLPTIEVHCKDGTKKSLYSNVKSGL